MQPRVGVSLHANRVASGFRRMIPFATSLWQMGLNSGSNGGLRVPDLTAQWMSRPFDWNQWGDFKKSRRYSDKGFCTNENRSYTVAWERRIHCHCDAQESWSRVGSRELANGTKIQANASFFTASQSRRSCNAKVWSRPDQPWQMTAVKRQGIQLKWICDCSLI